MRIHLELTATKAAQEDILLKQMSNWNSNQLNEKLESLQSKDIISLYSQNICERRISLNLYPNKALLDESLNIDEKEKELLLILNKYVSKKS